MYYDKVGLDYFKGLSKDRKVIVIPRSQKAVWEKTARAVVTKYIADKEKMGLPMKAYVKYFNERVKYHIRKQPSDRIAVKWVQENLLNK